MVDITDSPPQVEAFLAEYQAMCERHRMFVSACGCCGSPWLMDLDMAEKGHIVIGDMCNLPAHIAHLRGEALPEVQGASDG